MPRDNSRNILGDNNSNNQYDSSNVNANANGSIIERQEYIQTQIAAVAAGQVLVFGIAPSATNSTTNVVISSLAGYGNDFFNNQFYMQVLKNANSAGNAPEKQVRKITDYVSSTGAFVVDAFSAAIEENDLILILHESAVILGRDDADNIIATTNVVGNAQGSIVERIQLLQDQIAGTTGIATFPSSAAPANNVSLVEVVRDIWDSLRNGTGGSEPGANRSIIDEIKGSALNYNSINYLTVTADLSEAAWNEATTQTVFAITGLCRLRILVEITETCDDTTGDTATIQLGYTGSTNSIIGSTKVDILNAGDIWADTSPVETFGAFSSMIFDVISNGKDIGYEIGGEAAVDGTIVFHCWWEPLNSTGAVVAGTGQELA